MNKSIITRWLAGALLTAFALSGTVLTQGAAPTSGSQSQPKVEKPVIPLKVQVTLSRYDGEKKTSSLPFTLWVNANDGNTTTLNLGSSVPYSDQNQNYQYRTLGTNMSCSASTLDDGRFKLNLTLSDSSMSPAKDKTPQGVSLPISQSVSSSSYLLLRDGQAAQFFSATDKVTGEVTRIDVTVTVLK